MKVAFWSNVRGKSCVTSNLACISVLAALGCPERRTIVLENHQNIVNLGSTYFSPQSNGTVNENSGYTVDTGLGKVLQVVEKGERLSEEMFYRYARGYLGKQLFYLPTESVESADALEYQMARKCGRTLRFLEHYGEMILIDTSAAPLESSRRILQEVDLVVVNLNQNKQMLSHFFRNYSALREKAFYLIGNYDDESEMNKYTIMGKYGVPEDEIGTIPHNTQFADAVSGGRLIPFLLKNYRCGEKNVNFSFMRAAKEAEQLIRDRLWGGTNDRGYAER